MWLYDRLDRPKNPYFVQWLIDGERKTKVFATAKARLKFAKELAAGRQGTCPGRPASAQYSPLRNSRCDRTGFAPSGLRRPCSRRDVRLDDLPVGELNDLADALEELAA
jgi:hypothetical protein